MTRMVASRHARLRSLIAGPQGLVERTEVGFACFDQNLQPKPAIRR